MREEITDVASGQIVKSITGKHGHSLMSNVAKVNELKGIRPNFYKNNF